MANILKLGTFLKNILNLLFCYFWESFWHWLIHLMYLKIFI